MLAYKCIKKTASGFMSQYGPLKTSDTFGLCCLPTLALARQLLVDSKQDALECNQTPIYDSIIQIEVESVNNIPWHYPNTILATKFTILGAVD